MPKKLPTEAQKPDYWQENNPFFWKTAGEIYSGTRWRKKPTKLLKISIAATLRYAWNKDEETYAKCFNRYMEGMVEGKTNAGRATRPEGGQREGEDKGQGSEGSSGEVAGASDEDRSKKTMEVLKEFEGLIPEGEQP